MASTEPNADEAAAPWTLKKAVPLVALIAVAVGGFTVALLVAGGDAPAPVVEDVAGSPGEAGSDEAGAAEAVADYDITVEAVPDPPVVGGTTFVVLVADGSDPVTGADVGLTLDMAEHSHDPVRGEGEETEPGRYEVPVSFAMRGRWDGSVHVRAADGAEAREPVSYQVE